MRQLIKEFKGVIRKRNKMKNKQKHSIYEIYIPKEAN